MGGRIAQGLIVRLARVAATTAGIETALKPTTSTERLCCAEDAAATRWRRSDGGRAEAPKRRLHGGGEVKRSGKDAPTCATASRVKPRGFEIRGCGAGTCREPLVEERRCRRPAQDFVAYPQRFSASRPGLSPGGCGEPRIVAPRVTAQVPDLQPALDAGRLEIDPLAGRDGGSVGEGALAGIRFLRNVCLRVRNGR